MGGSPRSYLCGDTLLNMKFYGNFRGNLYWKEEGGTRGYRKGVPSGVQDTIGHPSKLNCVKVWTYYNI